MDHALRHRECAISNVDGQEQFGNRVEGDPHPVRRARQALERLGLADLTGLDRAEQGEEFVKLDLCDVHVVQEMAGKRRRMLGDGNEPGQDRVGINLEDAGHSTDAQALRQGAHRPHQLFGRDALAMERRAVRLQKIALTGTAVQLAPGSTAGMPVGTEIAPVHPAPIVAVGIGAEMLCGVHLAWASPAGGNQRWGGRWRDLWVLGHLLTGRTVRLVDEARKGFRLAAAHTQWWCGLGWRRTLGTTVTWPHPMEHTAQPYKVDPT